jgi:hypothetical protein
LDTEFLCLSKSLFYTTLYENQREEQSSMQKKVFRSFLIFLVYFCAVPLSFSADREPDVQKILNRLEKTWKIQQKEIATAHLVYRHVHGQKMDVKTCRPLTPQQLSDIIQAIDYTSSEKAFNEMVSKTLYAGKIFIPSVELYYSVPKYLFKSSIHPGNVKDNKTTIEKESYGSTSQRSCTCVFGNNYNKRKSIQEWHTETEISH